MYIFILSIDLHSKLPNWIPVNKKPTHKKKKQSQPVVDMRKTGDSALFTKNNLSKGERGGKIIRQSSSRLYIPLANSLFYQLKIYSKPINLTFLLVLPTSFSNRIFLSTLTLPPLQQFSVFSFIPLASN